MKILVAVLALGLAFWGYAFGVSVLAFYFKADNGRTFFDIFVSLRYFVGRKRQDTLGTVR